MLYDLGQIKVVSRSTAWLLISAGLLGSAAMICVMLAIAVRIGDLLIGW